MAKNFDLLINRLKEETKKLDNKYEEIQRMLARKGPYDQTFTTLMYVESETRVLLFFLWIIRKSTTIENTDIGTLRIVTHELLTQITEFLFNEKRTGFKNLHKILGEAKKALNENISRGQMFTLIEVLIQFIGKLNFMIDNEIPWYPLIETYKQCARAK